VGERLVTIREGEVYRDPAGRWTIRPYRPGDEVAILNLFRRVFGVDRSLEHWRWKFQHNPVGRHIRLAENSSGVLVAQYAGLPALMKWAETTVVATQIIDVMVDPGFRQGLKRPGLFARLASHFIEGYEGADRVSVGYGFPTPLALRIGREVAGYTPLHPVVGLVRDLGQAGPKESGLPRGKEGPPWNARLFRIEAVDRFGQEIDRLWELVSPELAVATIRTARYLNWRYADCPDVRYHKLVAVHRLSGAVAAVAILRLGVREQPVAALVDWLMPSRSAAAAAALMACCEEMAREAGMDRLEAWFPSYTWPYRFLLTRGFRPEPTSYSLVALSGNPVVSLDWAKDRWYYTMGDSDIY